MQIINSPNYRKIKVQIYVSVIIKICMKKLNMQCLHLCLLQTWRKILFLPFKEKIIKLIKIRNNQPKKRKREIR